ncbi:DUF982 domain-containing protein [Rhizobium sp. SEMIA 4085]|uniref:DUF982 domain-containing protein n=1 Tax=Rhizobium gallicum bv. gallicum R602sp TaxID=1041138 RepID=A0A0B4XFR6_9HYPH|nr:MULTISPECIES: DUF982 domain-containing protein [Rhizobium]AJD45458.1 hypothetical protein RGR602_PC01432 [Rhizobium gallicum bv. gallicum R602sp]NNH28444.1 DUF982 domain-containing protein [Rhizobium sp. SEMIA 4085]TDW32710.1 uncharacterized protein DUF982 [Rhizobium azibense]
MLVSEVPWRVPVTVRLECGLERTFNSAFETIDFLENEWPERRGERYHRAVNQCRGALSRVVPAEVAREAFIAACLEAGMPALTGTLAARRQASAPNLSISA